MRPNVLQEPAGETRVVRRAQNFVVVTAHIRGRSGTPVAIAPTASTSNPTVEDIDMGILAWVILGLIAGAIAKAIMPGRDPGGFIVTALIGIVGAVIGGFLGNMIFGIGGVSGVDIRSILISVVGALLLLWIYRMAVGRRAL